jgi:hypothetical protein
MITVQTISQSESLVSVLEENQEERLRITTQHGDPQTIEVRTADRNSEVRWLIDLDGDIEQVGRL